MDMTGPVVGLLSFGCSIGDVPLAAVLWNGGISFGGVVAFIFADLIIVPILVIYRKYYGTKMMLFILATFYATMAGAGYLIELIFGTLGLTPAGRHAKVIEASIQWNYTSVLNIIFVVLAAALCYRFARTGGIPMLKMMGHRGRPPRPLTPKLTGRRASPACACRKPRPRHATRRYSLIRQAVPLAVGGSGQRLASFGFRQSR